MKNTNLEMVIELLEEQGYASTVEIENITEVVEALEEKGYDIEIDMTKDIIKLA